MGGMIAAIERGFPQAEIARASYEYQQKVERGEASRRGGQSLPGGRRKSPSKRCASTAARKTARAAKLRALRKTRNNGDVERSLQALRRAAGSRPRMRAQKSDAPLLDAVRSYATLGEICGALREVFGTYEERPHI